MKDALREWIVAQTEADSRPVTTLELWRGFVGDVGDEVAQGYLLERSDFLGSRLVGDFIRPYRNRVLAKAEALERVARSVFALRYTINDGNEHKPLGDCTKAEIAYIAAAYEARAAQNQNRADAFRLIQDKLPDDEATVRDVLTEGQLSALLGFEEETE